MKREQDPISEKDSDDNDNIQSNIDSKLKKTGQIPQFIRNSQSLTVKLNAVIRSGFFKEFQTLSVFYIIVSGQSWKKVSGQITGVSQMSHSPDGQIVWNFPIQIIYETNYLSNPPQIVFIFYGHDFFGRTIPKAYGNMHFPLTEGIYHRKLRTFKINQYSMFTKMYSLMTGSYYELKEVEKVLNNSEQRANLKTQTSGTVSIEFETKRYNFEKYGYDE